MSLNTVKCLLGDSEIIIETGKMAKQAGGAVTVRSGDTIVLVVATSSQTMKEKCDFLPLTVEYLEKTFAAGKIPGGFFKREGRPSETAILTARFIDRPIRPLFPENYHFDTQVIATVLSASPDHLPEMLAMIGASASLCISDIPFIKPIAGCRVSRIHGEFKINLSLSDLEKSDLDLVVAASEDAVLMVEGEAHEASETDLIQAIEFAFKALQPVIKIQKELQAQCGKAKREVPQLQTLADITGAIQTSRKRIEQALAIKEKQLRYSTLDAIKAEIKEKVLNDESPFDHQLQLMKEFENVKSDIMRSAIIKEGKRIDGRGLKDIRPISCEVGLLPRVHGSALFTRGETQALVAATLGSSSDEQIIDGLLAEQSKRFMLNYNFPSFSVGEVKPLRSPGRREIGHGFLAERSLLGALPSAEDFSYTIRIVSEILESNGSSSMATVCGGSLAMMDAGVPITTPIAGIAMGLIKEGDDFAVLSDILGDEDHLGDMDFKVTGSEKGVMALQMDIKIEGITTEIMQKALMQAKEGRVHILGCMNKAIDKPRETLSAYAPKLHLVQINPKKIRDVIGPGGKNIKGIIEETGVKMDVEDSGIIKIFSSDQDAIDRTIELIKYFTGDVEVGKLYHGTVKKITHFGAFVEVRPNSEGLLHISQISDKHVNEVTDVLSEGDKINVKVLAIDEMGKFKLTMKGIDQNEEIAS